MSERKQEALKIINALRNGVPTSEALTYTYIHNERLEDELRRILLQTASGIGQFKVITGAYGTGKTFALHYLMQEAVKDNFVVAKLTIDRAFRFNKLDDLYYYLMHNLYLVNMQEKTNFEDLFQIWIDNLQTTPYQANAAEEISRVIKEISQYNQSFGRAFLAFIRAKINKDIPLKNAIVSWLSGEANVPYQLKEQFEVVGKVDKQNMFDFLKAFLHLLSLLGYNGLVVLVDELDLILNERSDIRAQSYNNLKHLLDLLGTGEISNMSLIMSGALPLFEDEEKGIFSIQALKQRLGEEIHENLKGFADYRKPIIKLAPLSLEDFELLTEKVAALYQLAYGKRPEISPASLRNWVFMNYTKEGKAYPEITTRHFVTKLIEVLDIVEQNPDNHLYHAELGMHLENNTCKFHAGKIKR